VAPPRANTSDIISELEAAYKFQTHIRIRIRAGPSGEEHPDPRAGDGNSPSSGMKKLKKARDNGITPRLLIQLNHPLAGDGNGHGR